MIWCDIFPTLLSILLLFLVKIRPNDYWQSKVRTQLARFTTLDEGVIRQVDDIVDDISTSMGFVGSILAILFGIVAILLKEYIINRTSSLGYMECALLSSLGMAYVVALVRLFSMRSILLSRKCRMRLLCRVSYAGVFTSLLYIGYLVTIYIVVV